jgi:DNA-binding response OmpR family regulator
VTRARAHILLVDDNPKMLEVVEVRLRALGHRTTMAHDGEAALEVFARDKPDLVLLDVTMPDLNGYQACRALKRLDASTPVIFLTGKNEPADRFWALQSGADDFLNKPVDPAVVVRTITEHLDRR